MSKLYAEYVACIRSFAGIEADYIQQTETTTGTLHQLARKAKTADDFLKGCQAAEDAYRKSAGKKAKIPRGWINAKSVLKYALENGVPLTGSYSKVMQAVTTARKAEKAEAEAAEAGQDARSTPASLIPAEIRAVIHSIGNKVVQMLTAGGDEGKATVLRILGDADKALGDILRAVLPVDPVKDEDEEKAEAPKAAKTAKVSRRPRQPKAA